MKKKVSDLLQEKKDLQDEISSKEALLRKENSIIKGNPRSADPKLVYSELIKKRKELEKVKILLQHANLTIYPKIFEYDSLVAEKKLLESLKTHEGKKTIPVEKGKQEIIEMEAAFTKAEVFARVSEIDTQIKKLRDELTQFNITTEIEV